MSHSLKNVSKDKVGSAVQTFVDGDYNTIKVSSNSDGTYNITAD